MTVMAALSGGRWAVRAWVGALTVAVAAPVLRPGYVLSYDAVAVSRQTMLPDSLGVGEALPRAVPAEAVTVVLAQIIDGQWIQKGLLVILLVVAGLGAAALVPSGSRLVACIAATAYVWNPFVAERLVLGHWWLLLGYACLPWLVMASVRVAGGSSGGVPALVLLLALGSLVPTAGILSATVTVIVLAWCLDWAQVSRSARRFALVAALIILVNSPWWLPGLLHPTAGDGPAVTGVAEFAARPDSPFGVVGSVLGLGGVWNGDVVPTSRTLPWALAGLLLVLGGMAYGWPLLRQRVSGRKSGALVSIGGLGLMLALWTATPLGQDLLEALISTTSAFGLLRDSSKFVALWALPLAVVVALAAERLSALVHDTAARRSVLTAFALVPLLVLPDLALGVWGRLSPVAEPAAWSATRTVLEDSSHPGDVMVLPWSSFRAFSFNDDRVSLDPAPRWIPRPSVVDRRLVVVNGDNGISLLPEESQRSSDIERVLADTDSQSTDLARLGIGYVVVERDTPGVVPEFVLGGAVQVVDDPSLQLWLVPGPTQMPAWGPQTFWVVLADLSALMGVLLSGLLVLRSRSRAASGSLSPPRPKEGSCSAD